MSIAKSLAHSWGHACEFDTYEFDLMCNNFKIKLYPYQEEILKAYEENQFIFCKQNGQGAVSQFNMLYVTYKTLFSFQQNKIGYIQPNHALSMEKSDAFRELTNDVRISEEYQGGGKWELLGGENSAISFTADRDWHEYYLSYNLNYIIIDNLHKFTDEDIKRWWLILRNHMDNGCKIIITSEKDFNDNLNSKHFHCLDLSDLANPPPP